MVNYLEGKEILITGGTGTLGKELVRQLLRHHKPHGIRVFSRDELKQWQMRPLFKDAPVAYLVGDIRDPRRLHRAMEGVQVVINAAALKQVPSCEDNPVEAVKTNVYGTQNVLDAALDCGVDCVMHVSTDKAVKPVNLYGATKATAEKLIIQGNVYSGRKGTKLSCCRYGNVLGSRGSVAHVFKKQLDDGQPVSITKMSMTRFWITVPKVAAFLLSRICDMKGGEVFVPKMRSMGIYQMACAMAGRELSKERGEIIETGIRQGEKLHEILFAEEEFCCEYQDWYEVYATFNRECGRLGQNNYELRSDRNPNGELSRYDLLNMLTEAEI